MWGIFRDKNIYTTQKFHYDNDGNIEFSDENRIKNNKNLPSNYCDGLDKKKYLQEIM